MRPYEVVLIFDGSLEDEVIRAAIDRFVETVRARGGNPGRVDRWGKRRFAYELAHRWEGYYVLIEMTAEPTIIGELDRALTLADDVLRHKIIRVPKAALGAPRVELVVEEVQPQPQEAQPQEAQPQPQEV